MKAFFTRVVKRQHRSRKHNEVGDKLNCFIQSVLEYWAIAAVLVRLGRLVSPT
jgi:hypothetical protein